MTSEEVINNLKVLAKGGGFVFSAVHNIQANIPLDNLKALVRLFINGGMRNYSR